jgi:hypothetical protein
METETKTLIATLLVVLILTSIVLGHQLSTY